MNSTEKALLARGIDSFKARLIVEKGYTIGTLATCDRELLTDIGLLREDIDLIYNKDRPRIPDDVIHNLLYKSRNTCCICRDESKSIVIHHIDDWKTTRSNSEDNLVVLCLEHHDEAHTRKELSRNLTPETIRATKVNWEQNVKDHDQNIINSSIFKELNVIPIKLSNLKSKWFNFLSNLGMKVELVDDSVKKLSYDFKIYGKRELLVKVFEIDDIKELKNKDLLIKEFKEESFFDSLIILGSKPFLSENGYYKNEINIQLGWVYSHGEQDWDHVMLKEGYDISNSIFYIENFLYSYGSWKEYLTEYDFEKVNEIWEASI